MFSDIAERYDLMNRVMSAGRDQRWREEAVTEARLPERGLVLDLGAGTGDLSRAVLKKSPQATVIAADFSEAMLRQAKAKLPPNAPPAAADALQLPFAADTFDAVLSGWLLRNLADLRHGLKEMGRVTKPGGRVVSLEVAEPETKAVQALHRLYFHGLVPLLGAVLARSYSAYRYLPQSLEVFVTPGQLRDLYLEAGLRKAGYRRLALGGIVIHWGTKPGRQA